MKPVNIVAALVLVYGVYVGYEFLSGVDTFNKQQFQIESMKARGR